MDIEKPEKWAEHQKTYTLEFLSDVRSNAASFLIQLGRPNKGCSMDHINGSFGYITLQDAIAGRWRIYDYDTDELLGDFTSIEELIRGHWKVST